MPDGGEDIAPTGISIRSDLKDAFEPNLYVETSFQLLEIL